MVAKRTSLLRRIVALAAALVAGPALASTSGTELASWVSQHTDMPVAQVAIAGPDVVYGLEPLTPRLPTGEVIALVRTEEVATTRVSDRGFHSWDAHVLFDCNGGRMRVIRSATYQETNRQGAATPETPRDAWLTPERGQPAAQLLHAACDASYEWPLRGAPVAPAQPVPTRIASSPVIIQLGATPPGATPPPATDAAPAVGGYAIQVAYGPNAAAAARAIAKAKEVLGEIAERLTASTIDSSPGGKQRYTAVLSGFATVEDAQEACTALGDAGQTCITRRAPDLHVAKASDQPAAPSPAPRILAAEHRLAPWHEQSWAALSQGARFARPDQPSAPAQQPQAPMPAVAAAEPRSFGRSRGAPA